MEPSFVYALVPVAEFLLVLALIAGWIMLYRRKRRLALWIAGVLALLVALALAGLGLLMLAYSNTNWSL